MKKLQPKTDLTGLWFEVAPQHIINIFDRVPNQLDKSGLLKYYFLKFVAEDYYRWNGERIKTYIINNLNGAYKFAISYRVNRISADDHHCSYPNCTCK